MIDLELDVSDNYVVEHGENFSLNAEQFRKLIEAKFARNTQYAIQLEQREMLTGVD